jgi:hypothetical protein
VTWAIFTAAGFLAGYAIARWWTLVAALAFGIYVATSTGVDEVPPALLGLFYATFAAVGIAAGVFVRRNARSSRAMRSRTQEPSRSRDLIDK